MKNCKKTKAFESTTKHSLFSGETALLRNLFLRNKPNFNHSKRIASTYSNGSYNVLQPKPKNGANPNKANLPVAAKRSEDGKPISKPQNRRFSIASAKGNKPKQTQSKPIFLPFYCHLFTCLRPKGLPPNPNPIQTQFPPVASKFQRRRKASNQIPKSMLMYRFCSFLLLSRHFNCKDPKKLDFILRYYYKLQCTAAIMIPPSLK